MNPFVVLLLFSNQMAWFGGQPRLSACLGCLGKWSCPDTDRDGRLTFFSVVLQPYVP